MNWQAEDFWQYSVSVYARQGVAQRLLRLQDQFNLNVNLCLLCAYVSQRGMGLTENQLSLLVAALDTRQADIEQHRQARRQAKSGPEHSYKQMLQTELQLERLQQLDLIDTLKRMSLNKSQLDNLQCYVVFITGELEKDTKDIVTQLNALLV